MSDSNLLTISSSPHIRDNNSVQKIMLDVVIALIPTVIASFYFFGLRAILHTFVAVFTEFANNPRCVFHHVRSQYKL